MATPRHVQTAPANHWGPLPPHALPRPRHRGLRLLERLLIIVGILSFGYFGYVSVESALYQAPRKPRAGRDPRQRPATDRRPLPAVLAQAAASRTGERRAHGPHRNPATGSLGRHSRRERRPHAAACRGIHPGHRAARRTGQHRPCRPIAIHSSGGSAIFEPTMKSVS
jgi:hypothetical protein